MGFGGLINSTNKTEGYDFRQGASESGLLVNAGGSGAKDQATAITAGGYATVNKIGSTEISNTGNSGTINYGLSGDALIKGISTITHDVGDIVGKQSESATGQINSALGKLSDLAESKQTDGKSGTDKTVLYVILGVLALVGLIFFRK